MASDSDAGDDAQFSAALGAGLDVDGEDAFQALHRCHVGKGLSDLSWRGVRFLVRRTRDAWQFGAKTPWNWVRFNRGRGTNAAGGTMESSGSRTTWGSRREMDTPPRSLVASRALAMAGRVVRLDGRWRRAGRSPAA